MRILFVDDEPRISEGIERMFFHLADEWDITCVNSGPAALQELEDNPYEVIVSDMRMPEMAGATLLSAVQKRAPEVVRIILSGQANLEETMRAVPLAHQYLAKPCRPEVLEEVIERACHLRGLLNQEAVRRAMGQISQIPSVPRLYMQLSRVLEEPDTSVDDVADIVSQDPAMSAKLLQMVNSAFFGRAQVISGVRPAVARLGFQLVKDLVLLVEVFRAPKTSEKIEGFSVEKQQQHALRAAFLAKKVIPDRQESEAAFTAAILHDIGKLIMAAELPDKLAAALAMSHAESIPLHEAEQQIMGASHAEVGAYVLGLWNLPHAVVEAVANHHDPRRVPQRTGFGVLGAVHVADCLANNTEMDAEYIAELGVQDRLDAWREMAAETGSD